MRELTNQNPDERVSKWEQAAPTTFQRLTVVRWASETLGRLTGNTLGDRSMVGQCPLEAFIQVRILVAQPGKQLLALSYQLSGSSRGK